MANGKKFHQNHFIVAQSYDPLLLGIQMVQTLVAKLDIKSSLAGLNYNCIIFIGFFERFVNDFNTAYLHTYMKMLDLNTQIQSDPIHN